MTRYTYEVVEIERHNLPQLERELNALVANGQRVVSVVWLATGDESTGGSYEIWLERTSET